MIYECECGNPKDYSNTPACQECMLLDGNGVQQSEVIHILLQGPRTLENILEGGMRGGGGRTGAVMTLLAKGRIKRIFAESEEIYYGLI